MMNVLTWVICSDLAAIVADFVSRLKMSREVVTIRDEKKSRRTKERWTRTPTAENKDRRNRRGLLEY